MTTLEPGASVVFTHGLRSRPASTALRASSAAPTITDGLEVLVHEVIAAITTEPWSTVVLVPSSSVTSTGAEGRRPPAAAGPAAAEARGRSPGPTAPFFSAVNGSYAGNVPAISSSRLSSCTYEPSASRNARLASA